VVPSEFHWVASYAPVSKVCVPHSQCWVWSAAPADWSGWSQAFASHCPLTSAAPACGGIAESCWCSPVQFVVSYAPVS
jgi:hypothetical protein